MIDPDKEISDIMFLASCLKHPLRGCVLKLKDYYEELSKGKTDFYKNE